MIYFTTVMIIFILVIGYAALNIIYDFLKAIIYLVKRGKRNGNKKL